MHFTREPIIETVITPREGFRLSLRNSKGGAHEEHIVEAVEVISLGSALFFRCLEKPKAFLLPVTDYELLETRETRVLLKSVSLEKSIKIGGGREASLRVSREKEIIPEKESIELSLQSTHVEETPAENVTSDPRLDKRRDRRRHRRRRPNEERSEVKAWVENRNTEETTPAGVLGGDAFSDETASAVSSSLFSALIPPPTTLISETLARYKDQIHVVDSFSTTEVDEPARPRVQEDIGAENKEAPPEEER